MTVNATPAPWVDYIENGATLVHAVDFEFDVATELRCSRIALGIETVLTLGLDYNVAGGAGGPGTVTKMVAGSGSIFRIRRQTGRDQPTDYGAHDDFPAEAAEAALDRIAKVNQEQDSADLDMSRRAFVLPPGELGPPIPPRWQRAAGGFFWGFQPGGDFILYSEADIREMVPRGETGAPGSGNLVGFYVDDYCTVNTAAGNTAGLDTLSDAVNAAGGGVIDFTPGKIYVVGAQEDHAAVPVTEFGGPGGLYRYIPTSTLLKLSDCKGVIINMNGAKMIAAPGLRHGAFNADGTAMASANGYQGVGAAMAYDSMIWLERCTDIIVRDGELDGNANLLFKGGYHGDSGYQLRGYGLRLVDCERWLVTNIYTHHHPADGWLMDGACATDLDEPEYGFGLNVRSELNGRQGMSLVGGKGLTFKNCAFQFTGKNSKVDPNALHPFLSAPAEGVDIEPSGGKIVRDIEFENCRFVCCWQGSMAADQGDAKNVFFKRCTFIADLSFAVWPKKPRFKFEDCKIVGQVVNPWPSSNPADATQFVRCNFYDDAAMVPTGVAPYFAGPTSPETVADTGGLGALNVLFDRCNFTFTGPATGPFGNVTMKDCWLSQARSDKDTVLQGAKFVGNNDFTVVAPAQVLDVFSTKTGHCLVNGVDRAVSPELVDLTGLRLQSHDGSVLRSSRIAYYADPVAWAATVPGGAVVKDIVIEPNITGGAGPAFMSICITAPGNNAAHWKKILQATHLPYLGAPPTAADWNDLLNVLMSANLMATS